MNQPEPLVTVERRAIIVALIYTHGHTGKAARILLIGRSTLYRRMHEFQIRPDEYQTKSWAVGA